MSFMKAIFLVAFTIVACGLSTSSAQERRGQRPRETTKLVLYDPAEVKPYVSYLEEHAQPPVDYVMELFSRFDLVILCERTHPEITQWVSRRNNRWRFQIVTLKILFT